MKEIIKTDSRIRLINHLDHIAIRLGIRRMNHIVQPGLYSLGNPGPGSQVFVTANYTLSFDALRFSLSGRDCYILVLDTRGVNVWCAAGKRTFGTEELIRRIEETGLKEIVDHRKLILPQLGAPGVAAHKVLEKSGFRVTYGPVRAADLPLYIDTGKVTPEMRKVSFTLADRLVLVPVEMTHTLIPMILIGAALFFTIGTIPAMAAMSAILAGSLLFPLFLPMLPSRNFSTKGFFLGIILGLFFTGLIMIGSTEQPLIFRAATSIVSLLILPPVTAFLSLNFTGATSFTSRSGVKREIFRYFPVMVWCFGSGLLLFIGTVVYHYLIL